MKRLFKIGFDLSLLSLIPVLSWFLLGMIIDNNLINIFTLTYPIQFIYYILKSIFSTGANISKEKDKNPEAVMTGLVLGIVIAVLLFGLVLINIDSYITFMNMDITIYRTFAIYSVIQLCIQLIFTFILDKLYYEEKNDIANKYSIIFNLLNFVLLIGTALLTKNEIIIITLPLMVIGIFTLYVLIKSSNKFKFRINLLNCIKYDSAELFNNITFFFIFLFGLSNALEFGEKYALALTFIALITDTQWDTFDAIIVASQIDISKKKFNYIEHRNNAYKLMFLLLVSTLLMFLALYSFYDLDFRITLIYFLFEFINFIIYPIYKIKTCFMQLEWSAFKTTANKMVALLSRLMMSFVRNPYCTGIGQVIASIYQFVSINLFFKRYYVIRKNGFVDKR